VRFHSILVVLQRSGLERHGHGALELTLDISDSGGVLGLVVGLELQVPVANASCSNQLRAPARQHIILAIKEIKLDLLL
jgi:hypothetical protein